MKKISKDEFIDHARHAVLAAEFDIKAAGVDLTLFWSGKEDNMVPISRGTALMLLGVVNLLRSQPELNMSEGVTREMAEHMAQELFKQAKK